MLLTACEPAATCEARKVAELDAGVLRSVTCFDAQDALAKAKAFGPFEVVRDGSACKVVAKNLPADGVLPAGLRTPSSYGDDCNKFDEIWKEGFEAWEAAVKLTVALDCDKEGKPTQKLNDHAKLAALDRVARYMAITLPRDPKSPGYENCVSAVSSFVKKSLADMQKLRCEVLKAEGEVSGMTSGPLLSRLKMSTRDIDEDGSKLRQANEALRAAKPEEFAAAKKRLESETLTLIRAQKDTLCGKAPELTPPREREILSRAVSTCKQRGTKTDESSKKSNEEKGPREEQGSGLSDHAKEEAVRRAMEQLQESRRALEKLREKARQGSRSDDDEATEDDD
jgi:hypothetical protein